MSRFKDKITPETNERDYPHIIELAAPVNGLRHQIAEIEIFHREHTVAARRGKGRHDDGHFYMHWCFADPNVAEAFKKRFDGKLFEEKPNEPAGLIKI